MRRLLVRSGSEDRRPGWLATEAPAPPFRVEVARPGSRDRPSLREPVPPRDRWPARRRYEPVARQDRASSVLVNQGKATERSNLSRTPWTSQPSDTESHVTWSVGRSRVTLALGTKTSQTA